MCRKKRVAIIFSFILVLSLFITSPIVSAREEWLDCNGFDDEFLNWTLVGDSPYLDAQDEPSNYIYTKDTGNVLSGWYYFPPPSYSGVLTVNISIYCKNDDGAGNDYAAVYINYSGAIQPPSESGIYIGDVGQHTNWQYDTIVIGNLTATEVNNLLVYFKYEGVTAKDDVYIDHVRLGITSYPTWVTKYFGGTVSITAPAIEDLSLTNPSVSPTSGVDSYTLFHFNITWISDIGNDPGDGYLTVNVSRVGWYTNQSMSWVSGDNTTGAVYTYNTLLTAGSYSYTFWGYDGTYYNDSGPHSDPTVSAQSFSFTVVTPSSGDALHFNEWTLSTTGVGLSTEYNVSEDNQTGVTPALTITNTGNVPLNISINWSGDPGSGITMKWATSDTAPNPGDADIAVHPSSTQIVTNLQVSVAEEIWLWMDFVSVMAQSSSENVKIWSELYE